MNLCQTDFNVVHPINFLPVMLDGVLLGYVDPQIAPNFVQSMRQIKITQNTSNELHRSVLKTLEIAYLHPGSLAKPEATDGEDETKARPRQDEGGAKARQSLGKSETKAGQRRGKSEPR